MKKILFHIGYPKSMSTFYQTNLFNRYDDITFFGLHPNQNVGEKNTILNETHSLRNDWLVKLVDINSTLENLKQEFNSLTLNSSNDIIISYERITSPFFNQMSVLEKIDRIMSVFSEYEIKILILKRDLKSYVISQYREQPYIFSGSFRKHVKLNKWVAHYSKNKDLFISPNEIKNYCRLKDVDVIILDMHLQGEVQNSINDYFNKNHEIKLSTKNKSNKGISSSLFYLRLIVNFIGLRKIIPLKLKSYIIYVLNLGSTKEIIIDDKSNEIIERHEKNWNSIRE
jgi:hypothetical protein